MDRPTHQEMVLALAERQGLVTDKEIRSMGVHPQTLKRLVDSGKLVRAAQGRYRLPDSEYAFTEHHGLVLAAGIAPKGVICLISALQFHSIGTQLPRQLWMALPRGVWKPTIAHPPMHFVRMSGDAYASGIEEHVLEEQTVRIYSIAKTVVDCFKFRNKIGIDVTLEALNESWRERKLNLDHVAEYARICRVWNVMRPYLEAITA